MKTNIKAVSALAIVVALTGAAGVAFAQDSTTTTTTTVAPVAVASPSTPSQLAPMIVSVDDQGNALVRGVVLSTSPNSLTLRGWGGTWTINTNSSAEVDTGTGSVFNGDMSNIAVGDFVGAEGAIDGNNNWTVDATVVRDWTTSPLSASDVPTSSTISTAPMIPATTTDSMPVGDTLYTGTVTSVGAGTITFTDASGNTETANVDPSSATIWNNTSTALPLASIQTGDTIRLDGSLSSDGTTINADVVRDTSQ
jgi:hypothetical protein